jgi:uncharacterized protein HemY
MGQVLFNYNKKIINVSLAFLVITLITAFVSLVILPAKLV